jgi:transcriptional regulator GlxA family with amidase domain
MNETRLIDRRAITTDPGHLVRQAMTLFESDRDAAWRCLTEASTLLGSGRSHSASQVPGVTAQPGGLAGWQVRQTLAYIEDNLSSRIVIADLAGLLALSNSHFSRAFRQRTGIAPMQYVVLRRVERAKSLIRGTHQPLAQVALTCGFSDQSHLSRRFHGVVGVCPGKWRRGLDRDPPRHAGPITAFADQ